MPSDSDVTPQNDRVDATAPASSQADADANAPEATHEHLPVLLVHGLNARDWSLTTSPCWGRIPRRLREAGFPTFFANQDSWYGIDHNADQIAAAIEEVIARTGAPKLHLVAHSKGGLDARSAVHHPGIAAHVASLTTFATPHRGLNYATWLSYFPFIPKYLAAPFARIWAKSQGDPDPEMMQLLADMTREHLADFDERYPDIDGIEYRSYAFIARRPRAHVANPATMLLHMFDGRNDGVVPYWSTDQPHRQFVYVIGHQKITHDEAVDMHRRDITLMMEDGTVYPSMPDFTIALLESLDAAYWRTRPGVNPHDDPGSSILAIQPEVNPHDDPGSSIPVIRPGVTVREPNDPGSRGQSTTTRGRAEPNDPGSSTTATRPGVIRYCHTTRGHADTRPGVPNDPGSRRANQPTRGHAATRPGVATRHTTRGRMHESTATRGRVDAFFRSASGSLCYWLRATAR